MNSNHKLLYSLVVLLFVFIVETDDDHSYIINDLFILKYEGLPV